MLQDSDIQIFKGQTDAADIDDELLLFRSRQGSLAPDGLVRLNYIFLGLVRQGRATLRLDTAEKALYPGDLVIGGYHSVVEGLQTSPDFEALCVVLSTRFFNDIVVGLNDLSGLYLFTTSHPVLALSEQEAWLFSTYWEIIRRRTTDQTNPYRVPLVRTQLLALLYELAGIRLRVEREHAPQLNRNEYIFRDFIRLLERHFRHERAVSFYADKLCISPKHLAHATRKVSRQTPGQWIDSYVVREACRLLLTTDKSIKEISLELHFPNQSFFGAYFRARIGLSPTNYRQQR